MKAAITLLSLLVISSGYFINDSFAVSENQAFLLEGSGFAVTEETIKISDIDLGISSQEQRGSSINFVAENGFITLNEEEFLISNLEGKFLREGKYIRINGEIESSNGFDTTISFFGRLVEESKDASVYGFTGRITTSDDTFKIIYTTKLSTLSKIDTTSSEIEESNNLTLYILKGSSSSGVGDSYIDAGSIRDQAVTTQSTDDPLRLRYFSQDRIEVPPGTTITIINDDDVSHSLLSGTKTNDRHIQYIADNRISTGEILPGKSTTITFDELGFYRLYDPDYQWMGIIAYVFPSTDNVILGEGQNSGN